MDFALSPETQDTCKRISAFLDRHVIPLESDPASYGEGENIRLDLLADLRKKARAENLWCLQIPKAEGGNGLPKGQTITHMAACYEAAGRSIFGPVCFNIAAPDDGNLYLLNKVATPAQKEKWLNPILRGEARSAIVMTEPAPGSGSDPAGMMKTTATRHGDTWVIKGHKWFITGAGVADYFILLARTSDDPRRGLTTFLFHKDQPGWKLVRRIPIMGPEEHGGHCELTFDGLEIKDSERLMEVGEGLKAVQIRLGVARLTHCMRWLGMAKRALEIAGAYVKDRESFGTKLIDHEGVQWMLGEAAMQIATGRLLTMHAAWRIDQGHRAQKEVAMAKIAVADVLHKAIATSIQLCGARGYSKDTLLEWMYRYAPQARLVDGASEVHKMLLAKHLMSDGRDFWQWGYLLSLSDRAQAIADFIAHAAGAKSASVTVLNRLGGGAIQENWAIDVAVADGPQAGQYEAVLRGDAVSGIAESWPRAKEYALIAAAHAAGVTVPQPLWLEPSGSVTGRPFYVMRRVKGIAQGRRLLRSLEGEAGDALARRLGEELAKLHRIRPENAPDTLSFLPKAGADLITVRAAHYRKSLDALPEPQPILEWAINRMEDLAPPIEALALCHRDFRTGNYMAENGALTAILDFEFSGWSDPYEDLGWFCARCWRFGAVDREAGGIGSREAFTAGYESGTGQPVDDARLRYWEAIAPIRWAIIALQQGERHASGQEPSLDLALTGLRAIECDYDLLAELPKLKKVS